MAFISDVQFSAVLGHHKKKKKFAPCFVLSFLLQDCDFRLKSTLKNEI